MNMRAMPAYLAYMALALLAFDAASIYKLTSYDPGPKKDIFGSPIDPALSHFVPMVVFNPPAEEEEGYRNDCKPEPEEYSGDWLPLNDRQSASVAHSEPTGIILTLHKKNGTLPRLILKAENPKLNYGMVATSAKINVAPTSIQRKDGPTIGWIQVMDQAGTVLFAGTVEVYGIVYPETLPQTPQAKPASKAKPAPAAPPKKDNKKEKRSRESNGLRAFV